MATTSPPKQRIQVPDINVLPEEYRRPAASSQTVLFLLVVLVTAFAIYSLYPLRAQANAEKASIDDNLQARQQELKKLQGLEPRVKELKETLSKLETRQKDLQAGWGTFQKGQVKWRLILDGIQGKVPKGITINAMSQQESVITVQGVAPSLGMISEYANALRDLGLTSDLGITYGIEPGGVISFNLRLVIKPGGRP